MNDFNSEENSGHHRHGKAHSTNSYDQIDDDISNDAFDGEVDSAGVRAETRDRSRAGHGLTGREAAMKDGVSSG